MRRAKQLLSVVAVLTVVFATFVPAQPLPSATGRQSGSPCRDRSTAVVAASPPMKASLGDIPLHIIENRGVHPDEVRFYVHGRDKSVFFARDGITFALRGEKDRNWAVKLEFVSANEDVVLLGSERRNAVFSYFRGTREEWKAGLSSFTEVVYEELWPGIDLVYRGERNALKYEFRVRPGADPKRIRLRYNGATAVEITDTGGLRVETPVANLADEPPVAWTEGESGLRSPVGAAFAVDEAAVRFEVGDYDTSRMLVIDPAVLVYCGYLGGIDADVASSIAVDPTGAAYVVGGTLSSPSSFPVKVGPDLSFRGRGLYDGDAFIAKIAPDGKSLVYCGYIGGSAQDVAFGVAVDASGSAYVVGLTTSSDGSFPVAVGPDVTFNGLADAFIAKVTPSGTGLAYCGFIGGANADGAFGVCVDAQSNAYVSGYARSDQTSFPVVVGPDLTYNSAIPNIDDAFVAKVVPDGSSLAYCGYIGGDWSETGYSVAVNASGELFVAGTTVSTSGLPLKVGPGLTYNGRSDGWVACVSASGSSLKYCGLVGGAQHDGVTGIAIDAQSNAYLFGTAGSDEQTFPVRVGPDLTKNGADHFVARVASSGRQLDYCGYIGGKFTTSPPWPGSTVTAGVPGIAVDRFGYAYVAGQAVSDEQSFPVVAGPGLVYQGAGDGFVARVDPDGSALSYCGYIGGTAFDTALGIAVDGTGNLYVCGMTVSPPASFPIRSGPQLSMGGSSDAFVAKVAATDVLVSGAPRVGTTIALTLRSTDDAGLPYQMGASLTSGSIPLGAGRTLRLAPDPLLATVVAGSLPGVFQRFSGVLDSRAIGASMIAVPKIQALVGIALHVGFVTLDPAAPLGIKSVSGTARLVIMS